MRLRPLFLAPILLLLIMFAAPVNGVSQYVGYLASQHNAGCGTCANSVNTSGDVSGLAVVAPFTGQLVQVSVYLDNIKPTAIVIATFPAGTSPTRTLDAGCLSLCGHVDAGQSFTVQDTEGLSGLTSFAFQTITLASPVSVAGSQWIGLLFVVPSNANNWVANCQTSCNSPPISTVAALTLPAGSSTVGSSYSSIVSSPGPVIGGIFQTIGSQPSFLTQCYGNCGSPPVTRSEEHTSELQSQFHLVCRLLLEKKKQKTQTPLRARRNTFRRQGRPQPASLLTPPSPQKQPRLLEQQRPHPRTQHPNTHRKANNR